MANLFLAVADIYLAKILLTEFKGIGTGSGSGSGSGGTGGHHYKGPIVVPPPLDPYGLTPKIMVSKITGQPYTSQEDWIKDMLGGSIPNNNYTFSTNWEWNENYAWTIKIYWDMRDMKDVYSPVNIGLVIFICNKQGGPVLDNDYQYTSLTNPWMLWAGINFPLDDTISLSNTLFDI